MRGRKAKPSLLKTAEQIKKMRASGRLLAEVETLLRAAVRPGITTAALNALAEEAILIRGGKPSFKGYRGFPAAICTSINDQIAHGIPADSTLENGDILSIDFGCILDGLHADMARTYAVGEICPEKQRLIQVTERSFWEGIRAARAGHYLNEIGTSIQEYVEAKGFSVVRDYAGHGIGTQLHEDPAVYNYKTLGRGICLQRGMVLAIEPMVNMGTHKLRIWKDGWTAVTRDGLCSAHYENTVLITDGEPEILTLYEGK